MNHSEAENHMLSVPALDMYYEQRVSGGHGGHGTQAVRPAHNT